MKKISLAILFVLFYLVSAGYVYAGVRWTVDGEVVCNKWGRQMFSAITGDGTGGAIIAWEDQRNGNWDTYAQRIDENGNLLWGTDAAVCTQGSSQIDPAITGDGTGGAIITWSDNRNVNYDIFAQRIDENGNLPWGADVAVSTAGNTQWDPGITGDGTGGAIITWQDKRNGNYDIYAQRIDESGNVKWVINGAAVCTQGSYQEFPTITGDGAGGAIITWEDRRNGNYDIYAQRIDEDGNVLWGADAAVCTQGSDQNRPEITGDGTGGAIITWYDWRNGNTDIYAQRIDESGNVKWVINGAAVCTQGVTQYNPAISGDGTGGAIIAWKDNRWDIMGDILAQRIDENGNLLWGAEVAVCTAGNTQIVRAITGDGTGGAIITWEDERNGNWDIYAQRISNPAPGITSINPQSADVGDTLDVAVSGSWFYLNPSAIFSGAGITLNTVSRVSEAELMVNITISEDAATGTRDVTVTNLDGQSGTKTRAFVVMGPGEGKVKIQAGSEGWANPLKGEEVNIYLKPKHSGNVSIEIYTIAGQLVWEKEISVTGGVQEQVVWNCRNKSDEVVSSGIYAVRVKGGGIDTVKKAAVVK